MKKLFLLFLIGTTFVACKNSSTTSDTSEEVQEETLPKSTLTSADSIRIHKEVDSIMKVIREEVNKSPKKVNDGSSGPMSK